MVSARLGLRTYVLNVGFWNPALLAREVATLDVLSHGRAELGLGAGYAKGEHDEAGVPFPAISRRIEALEATVAEVRRRLADPQHQPPPVQRPVPVMVAAMSSAGLAVAARHADDRVAEVRGLAGGRPYRSDVLLQQVVIGKSPAQAAAEMATAEPTLTEQQILDSPFLLHAADARQAADELRRRRQQYGFDSVTTHQLSMEALGQVIAAYRAST